VLARALASRGVEADEAQHYLNPTLRALFPDPSSFMDMDRAATILVDALVGGRPARCSPTTTWTARRARPCWCAGSAAWARAARLRARPAAGGLRPQPRRLPPHSRGTGPSWWSPSTAAPWPTTPSPPPARSGSRWW
jgi:hypothetical protein